MSTSDLAETIARLLREALAAGPDDRIPVAATDLLKLAYAAESAATARDAALEEAAKVVEYIWDHGLSGAHGGEQCIRTAKAIRALKRRPA